MKTPKEKNTFQKELSKILERLHEEMVFGWIVNDGKPHTVRSHANNDGCTKQAQEAITKLVEELIPKHIDEDGSTGKWVNGFNDANQELKDKLRGE